MQNLPWYHCPVYEQAVLGRGEYVPHDRIGYLHRLEKQVPQIDRTVRAYLEESIESFLHGNLLASMVMLGVAAERVFDLLCDALESALADPAEHRDFSKLLPLLSVRKKL